MPSSSLLCCSMPWRMDMSGRLTCSRPRCASYPRKGPPPTSPWDIGSCSSCPRFAGVGPPSGKGCCGL
eukprot:11224500-Lingulodinium_polyedra.AAC.1